MKQIKVELTPREWAEKRLQLYCSFNHQPSVEILDKAIETCGFVLKDESETKPNKIPTNKVEAVKYFLNQLPEGYRERALAQVNDEVEINRCPLANSISDALMYFSIWSETKECGNFWQLVRNHYLNSTEHPTLPPLPNEESLDKQTTKQWTGHFTDEGIRVNVGDTFVRNGVNYTVTVEEKLGQKFYYAVSDNDDKLLLRNFFKYHKP